MAGDWLKIEVVTPDKPEVLQMAHELNLDPDAVFGKLFRVWSWFDSHSEEGNAPSVTEMLLDRQVGVSGFVNSMVSVGWMIKSDAGLEIPNFTDHNGATAKKRANTARRVAKHKKANAYGNDAGNEEVTPEALAEALAREEKRRVLKEYVGQAQHCIEYLNLKASKNYHQTEANHKPLLARFKEGYSVQDVESVIDSRVAEWAGDEKMKTYLRPATLFNAEKFNSYAGQVSPSNGLEDLSTAELIRIGQELEIPDAHSLNTKTLINRIVEARNVQ